MRLILATVSVSLFLVPKPGFACDRIDACDLRQDMTPAQFEKFQRSLKSRTSHPKAPRQEPKLPLNARVETQSPPPSKAPRSANFVAPEPTSSLKFLLRKDFEDIRLFSDIVSNADAEGAEFSLSRDAIKKDTTWTADAIAALAYTYTVEDIHSTFMGWTIAPYVRVNRELHSKNIDDNVDSTTLGLSGEVGFRNRLFGMSDHLRGSVAVLRDNVNAVDVTHASAEWIPYYLSRFGTIPGTFINYNFISEVKAEYDSTTATGKTLLFSGRQESLRVGPEATVRFKAMVPDGPLYDYLARFTAKVTYHWWTEVYSGRQDSWLDSSLTYNVDEEGHIGLKFSYKRGANEDTGVQTNLYKLSLTAKACADIFNKTGC